MRASENPVVGNDQKAAAFQEAIHVEFLQLVEKAVQKGDESASAYKDRVASAVRARYKRVRTECIKFDSYLRQVKAGKPTGDSPENDFWQCATAIYNGEAGMKDTYSYFFGPASSTPAKMPDKKFAFAEEYRFLLTTHQWQFARASSLQVKMQNKSDNAEMGDGEVGTVLQEIDGSRNDVTPSKKERRPIGNKRAVENEKAAKSMQRGSKGIGEIAVNSSKRVKIQQAFLELEKMKANMALFSMPGTDPMMAAQFLAVMQKQALASLPGNSEPVFTVASLSNKNSTSDEGDENGKECTEPFSTE